MGEPQVKEEQKPNSSAAKAAGKVVAMQTAKRAGLILGLKPILIIVAVIMLVVVLVMGGLLLTMQFADKEEPRSGGGWDIGGITEFGANEIPAAYIPIYKEAGAKYNVPWNLLAAIHRVETVFSTIPDMVSPVGAMGHTQFMPLTWLGWNYPGGDRLGNASIPDSILHDPAMIKKYGGYGVDANGDGKADPYDLEDAIFSTANYLSANGASKGDIEGAVYAYNHAGWYVEQVMGFADSYVDGYRAIEGVSGEMIDGVAWPTPGIFRITSLLGGRVDPVYGNLAYHGGIDIANGPAGMGSPVVSFLPGTVISAGWNGGYGNCVVVDHGNGLTSLYGHMSKINVSVGSKVKAGQQVGKIGSTGKSTGPHLHFTVKQNGNTMDPLKYLDAFEYQIDI